MDQSVWYGSKTGVMEELFLNILFQISLFSLKLIIKVIQVGLIKLSSQHSPVAVGLFQLDDCTCSYESTHLWNVIISINDTLKTAGKY